MVLESPVVLVDLDHLEFLEVLWVPESLGGLLDLWGLWDLYSIHIDLDQEDTGQDDTDHMVDSKGRSNCSHHVVGRNFLYYENFLFYISCFFLQ